MGNVLFLIPVLTVISGLILYRHNGKKEILKLDSVQFIYSFVLAPVIYIWLKSFLFYLLRDENALSEGELFIFDTFYSVFFIFVYAFVVIHSLTKSFELKRTEDPLHDVFTHSEFFHQWVSHLVFYLGSMLLFSIASITNGFFPLNIFIYGFYFYLFLAVSLLAGVGWFIAIWLNEDIGEKFFKLMKLFFSFLFLLHVLVYFWVKPAFNINYLIYWMMSVVLFVCVLLSAFINKLKKMDKSNIFFNSFHYKKK
jgi:hypothetical protein